MLNWQHPLRKFGAPHCPKPRLFPAGRVRVDEARAWIEEAIRVTPGRAGSPARRLVLARSRG